jgi:hypothetical protein
MRVSHTKTYSLMIGTFLSSMFLFFACTALAIQEPSPEVEQLLQETRDKAQVLSQDDDEMLALTRSNVSWESHADMLETIKQDVNDMAKIMQKLQASRSSASPWQQQAIDRMIPLLKDLATNTTAAINHLKEHQDFPTQGHYTDYLKQNYQTAQQLAQMVSDYVEYGESRARMEKLEQKLEVAKK